MENKDQFYNNDTERHIEIYSTYVVTPSRYAVTLRAKIFTLKLTYDCQAQWSRADLDKLIVVQVLKIFAAFYRKVHRRTHN
jgi:hypothetical protein